MLLVIDNYDSFTYNLVQYFGELGEDVQVYRNDKITLDQIEELQPSRLVISPGPCTPGEAGISVDAIRRFGGRLPDSRCLFGPSVHGRRLRRRGRPRSTPDAWEDVADQARRQDHLSIATQSV